MQNFEWKVYLGNVMFYTSPDSIRQYIKIQFEFEIQALVENEGLNKIRVRLFWKIPAGPSRAFTCCAKWCWWRQIWWAPLSTFEYQDDWWKITIGFRKAYFYHFSLLFLPRDFQTSVIRETRRCGLRGLCWYHWHIVIVSYI